MTWKDNFSKQADIYAKYRPQYPKELYDFLASQVFQKKVAWDCGTGNGQVATQLAAVFEQVIATDASVSQLAYATSLPNLKYRVATAERSGLAANSVNLITVAQAIHWFDVEKFYKEVRRVATEEAIIAVWGYGLLTISAAIDKLLHRLYSDILGTYWDMERRHLDLAYQTIPFPFATLEAPAFVMQASWNLAHLLGYLNTWSSVQKFIAVNHTNPLAKIESDLQQVWGKVQLPRQVQWEIYLKVGRVK
jgi:hypothetical protein